jgi:hypothetical protein
VRSGGSLRGPPIGFLIGRLSRPLAGRSRGFQVAISLVDLYLSAALFAVGVGLFELAFAQDHRPPFAVMTRHVVVVLWGLTFAGYWVVLWPLSFFTHRLVWRGGGSPDAGIASLPPPEVDISADAVRRVAVTFMLLAVLAQAFWSALAMLDVWHLSSRSPAQPWWIVVGLTRWSAWFVFGWAMWLAPPVLSSAAARAARSEGTRTASYGELAGVAGFILIAYPLLSFASTWIVAITKVTLVQSWAPRAAGSSIRPITSGR